MKEKVMCIVPPSKARRMGMNIYRSLNEHFFLNLGAARRAPAYFKYSHVRSRAIVY
jgi:hypothetical protein